MCAGFVAVGSALLPTGTFASSLEQVGKIVWQSGSIQGVSGLEVFENGTQFVAVSDLGWRISGEIARDSRQNMAEVTVKRIDPIIGIDGWPVSARRVGDQSDAEGLAIDANGNEYISFERWAHVTVRTDIDEPARHLRDHPEFANYSDNRQLEALAISPDGILITFPENPVDEGFPAFRYENMEWTISGMIPTRDDFSIVGADFAADGTLYVLERKLVTLLWWQSRIRRFDDIDLGGETILWTSERGDYTNLEGIAVWNDARGATRLTLVSDNNRDTDEPTEFVEFRLTD